MKRTFNLLVLVTLLALAFGAQGFTSAQAAPAPAPQAAVAQNPAYVHALSGNAWNVPDNPNAMNTVFGAGNWDDLAYETVNPAVLFSSAYDFIYMDGGADKDIPMNTFIAANQTLMETWVSNGGVLYLNSGGWNSSVNYGFGGVTANLDNPSWSVTAVNPAHPIFNGPFLPAGTSYTGSAFAHDNITGGSTSPVMTGEGGVILAETAWGSGHVMFGGLTAPFAWDPYPNDENLLANILAYLDGYIGPSGPGAFGKTSPANAATGVSTSPTLSWGASSGQTDYEYCIDPNLNSTCDSGGVWTSTTNATSVGLSGLAYANSYEWQVRAVNGSGNTEADGGTWWTFITEVAPPGAFGKTGPADGTISQSTTITMTWNASAGATSYEYCLDETPGATCTTTWVNVGNVLTVGQGGLPADSTFYWQVRAVNGSGNTEADGGTWWTFITDNTAPQVFVDSGPAIYTTSTSATFNFHATDAVGPVTIYCGLDGQPWQLCTSPTTYNSLSEGYHWLWLMAVDAAGNSALSSIQYGWVVDLTAPDFALVADNPYEATGPGGANAAYNASFSDANGIASQNCTPASGSLFPIGTTQVNCTGTDNAGNTTNVSFDIIVVDSTAPTLNLPANITVPQTIPAGAVVNFTVTATDVVDASPTIACVPPSGSTFPVGTTTVNCSATDDYSNTSNGSFTVTVTPAAGGNLIKKSDFANALVFPTPWQAFGFAKPYNNVLDCNFFNMGPCSVLFIAGNRSAMQRVTRSGFAGDTYSFGMYSAANAAPAGGKYLVEVAFYNNFNRLVGMSQLHFNLGTHGFELVSGPAVATGNYTKITFRFYYNNPSGRAWFDDAFLYIVGAP